MRDHPQTRHDDNQRPRLSGSEHKDDAPLCLLPSGITFYGSNPQQLYKALCDRMNLRGVPIHPSADPQKMLDSMNQHQLLAWSGSLDPGSRQTAMNIALTRELCRAHDWAMEACEATDTPNQFNNVWKWLSSQVAFDFHLVSELDQLDQFQAAGIGEIAISIIGQSMHKQRMRDINNGQPDKSMEQVPFVSADAPLREPQPNHEVLDHSRDPNAARRYRRDRSLIGRALIRIWRALISR